MEAEVVETAGNETFEPLTATVQWNQFYTGSRLFNLENMPGDMKDRLIDLTVQAAVSETLTALSLPPAFDEFEIP